MSKYIVIDAQAIQKRIEELEKERLLELKDDFYDSLYLGEINALKQILSQSTPLIPEIEKSFDAGRTVKNYKGEWKETYSDIMTSAKYEESKDYILNLKLDI